jgi:protein gp37
MRQAGESGPGARIVQKEWITEIRDQCIEAGIPFFFKQWGGVRKKQNGKILDGRIWNQFPLRLALA